MRRSSLRVYGPFIAVIVAQALLIVVAPSRGNTGQDVAAGEFGAPTHAPGEGAAVDGGGFDPATGEPVADGSTPGGTDGTDGSGGGGAGGSGGAGGGGGAGGAGAAASGDTSHCKGEQQFDVLRVNPPCRPTFEGDNGGATYQGVTGDSIKVVVFSSIPNPQVDAILASQGLAVSESDLAAFYDAAFKFIDANYELYGRKIEWVRVEGDCPTTPPDVPACNAAARKVADMKPFMVLWGTPLYASVFDIWARAGIISVGGWHFSNEYFAGRRPFRYDVFMQGSESADHLAEYFCKKLSRKPASHAGRVIHPTIGGRDTERKLGIVVPEIPANVATAQRVRQQVASCGGETAMFTYVSDIERANEQTQAVVSGLIDAGVTTVSCMCDPIAPAFLTKGMTQNGYFPEFLMPGLGLLDYDLLGRLYDKEQMAHAFGPSHLGVLTNLDDTDPARVWRAAGNQGHPCGQNGCGTQWSYVSFAAMAIHMAGPNLNPTTVERALLTAPPLGGTPTVPLVKYGQDDYTALSDVKEVFWSETATSAVDGRPGAFIPVADGRRYRLGQWPSNGLDGIPVASR